MLYHSKTRRNIIFHWL